MANLGYKKNVNTKGEYQKVSDILNIEFVVDKKYQIQILNYATVIISATKPTEGGIEIISPVPFGYTHKDGTDLYIKSSEIGTTINVSE